MVCLRVFRVYSLINKMEEIYLLEFLKGLGEVVGFSGVFFFERSFGGRRMGDGL